jgi:hypothetical protein
MTSVEKARIRNETLLKVTLDYDFHSCNDLSFIVCSQIKS